MPLSLLEKLTHPLVWTFHDLWPICGSLHHEYKNDLRYPEEYDSNNRPASRKGPDLDRRIARQKSKAYAKHNIEAIVPSRWMAEQVSKSKLWQNRPLTVIPIGLDTQIFKPIDKTAARDLLNLPAHKTIVLFGAMYAGSDKNKGYPQLQEALKQLQLPSEKVELAIFGMSAPAKDEEAPLPRALDGYPSRSLHSSRALLGRRRHDRSFATGIFWPNCLGSSRLRNASRCLQYLRAQRHHRSPTQWLSSQTL